MPASVRFLLTLPLLALVCAGCSTSAKKAARQAALQQQLEDSRAVEERRMRAIDRGDVASKRGAEIYIADPHKTFDLNKLVAGGSRKVSTGKVQTREFAYDQKFAARSFSGREFRGTKAAWMGKQKYSTSAARTKGEYAGPNAGRQIDLKTAATKEANEAGKTASTRTMPGANRAYLGPEAAKVKTALDPNNLPRSSNELHELKTVEDVRELLNKNQ